MSILKELSHNELTWGLELAQKSFSKYIDEEEILHISKKEIPVRFLEKQSCFVTYKKEGLLRGCIGSIFATTSLHEEIIRQSIQAGSADPRFLPISKQEYQDISTELTILSPITSIPNATNFTPGIHGIIISRNEKKAVFLPQVATEQNWGRDETLDQLAAKAGLQCRDWQLPGTLLEVFTAQKITDEK